MTQVDRSHSDRTDALPLSERHKIMRDALINNFAFVASGLVGIILVPLMLSWLGAESYGVWILAMTVAGVLATLDSGLHCTIVREVACSSGPEAENAVWTYVEGAANAYLLLGLLGTLLLGGSGYAMNGYLHLDPQLKATTRAVFWLVGISFLADQFNHFGNALLMGLRRFGYANLIRGGTAILRGIGFVTLLALGGSLVIIAIWQVVATVVSAAVTLVIVRRLAPNFHFRIARLHWGTLRQRISFALSSLLTTFIGGVTWQVGSLLIGFIEGSAAVVPFYIGLKFPFAASLFGWQAAETLFPAAGEHQNSPSRTREILRAGTRWVLVLLVPVSTLLWIVGPNLLSVWIGKLDPEALRVLRLMCFAALADAFMAASLNVLWGRAAMRRVVPVLLGVAALTVFLAALLVPKMGAPGAAWGVVLPMTAGAVLLFHQACRECDTFVLPMLRSIFRGLPFAAIGCAACGYLVTALGRSDLWHLVGACLAGSTAYASLIYFVSGENEERRFLESIFHGLKSLLWPANFGYAGLFRRNR